MTWRRVHCCWIISLLIVSSASIVRAGERRQGPNLASPKVPTAADLGTSHSIAWETTRPCTVAVSDSGVVYVIWLGRGQENAPRSPDVPLIPEEYSFSVADPEWSGVPGISVFKNGRWSAPALLVDGRKECKPLFAWCDGELLHLLVVSERKNQCNHLLFSPTERRWVRVAELPFAPSAYVAWQRNGKSLHVACKEGGWIYYLRFDGREWSKPLRIEQSENQSAGATQIRLAVDRANRVHLAWWTILERQEKHFYSVIQDGRGRTESLRLDHAQLYKDEFDLGIDPKGRVLLAYKADVAKEHIHARRVHVRYREGNRWTEPEMIGGEGDLLFGNIRVVWNNDRTAVTWLCREEYPSGEKGTVRWQAVRRLSVTDGKAWSPSRWVAWESNEPHRKALMGDQRPGICVDGGGRIHMAWGSPCYHYCVVDALERNRERE